MKYYIDFSARNKFEYMLIDGGWELPLPKQPGPDMYSGRALYDDTKSIAGARYSDAGRICEVEERPHLADHAFPGHAQPDGRSLRAIREMGHRRREDRLHGPHRPMDDELVPDGREESGRTPPHGRLPRRVQARRKRAHLPQRADARRRDGRGVQPVERASHSQAQRDARLHPHVGGADGLHARRVRQRDQGELRRRAPRRPW